MLRIGRTYESNKIILNEIDMKCIKEEAKTILHSFYENICITYESEKYLEIITCNE